MENPCKTCIVKVNCTQVCSAKKKFKTLLHNVVENFQRDRIVNRIGNCQNTKLEEQYYKYLDLLAETRVDIIKIIGRRHSADV